MEIQNLFALHAAALSVKKVGSSYENSLDVCLRYYSDYSSFMVRNVFSRVAYIAIRCYFDCGIDNLFHSVLFFVSIRFADHRKINRHTLCQNLRMDRCSTGAEQRL